MNGQIVRIHDNGFGFIKGENGKEYFFHRNEVINTEFMLLRPGDKVTFEEDDPPPNKGPRAREVNVRIAK